MAGKGTGVELVHAVPGRFRLRVGAAKGNPEVAVQLAELLADAPDVVRVEPNPATGSIVVRYRPAGGDWLPQVRDITQRLAPLVPGLEVAELAPQGGHTDGGHRPHPSHQVTTLFRDLNEGVASTTGGIDLKFLLPASLVILGVGSFFSAERLSLPRWYDFLWFGFGTFMMLNAAGVPAPKAAEEAAELAAAL